MSTFDGLVPEFPDVRIDSFRQHPDRRPPLACFLSHVHSDHLAGLDASSFRTFVYCSAATREILLRLERYPARANFANAMLETRVQKYKHLQTLLRPIPMETPTKLELSPGNHIQVTLLPANHCPGAVMFLMEGSGKAILYTGDVRSEPWFVNSIARSPLLLQYTLGIASLDKIYLDTSFLNWTPLQPKADGIAHLIRQVKKYPLDTIFHLETWTYGYEDVWIALSQALNTRIHLDRYKMAIYSSLAQLPALTGVNGSEASPARYMCPEAAALIGHVVGNSTYPGCLTGDHTVRVHSCEKGSHCYTIDRNAQKVVWIRPIVARRDGDSIMEEKGIGGGGSDLLRKFQVEGLDNENDVDVMIHRLRAMSEDGRLSEPGLKKARELLKRAVSSGRGLTLNVGISDVENSQLDLDSALLAIAEQIKVEEASPIPEESAAESLPRNITFPYARHSSLPELRDLVSLFKPKDVWPCTVHIDEWYEKDISMAGLFGDLTAVDGPGVFTHDVEMAPLLKDYGDEVNRHESIEQDTQTQNNYSHQLQPPRSLEPQLSTPQKRSPLPKGLPHRPSPTPRSQRPSLTPRPQAWQQDLGHPQSSPHPNSVTPCRPGLTPRPQAWQQDLGYPQSSPHPNSVTPCRVPEQLKREETERPRSNSVEATSSPGTLAPEPEPVESFSSGEQVLGKRRYESFDEGDDANTDEDDEYEDEEMAFADYVECVDGKDACNPTDRPGGDLTRWMAGFNAGVVLLRGYEGIDLQLETTTNQALYRQVYTGDADMRERTII